VQPHTAQYYLVLGNELLIFIDSLLSSKVLLETYQCNHNLLGTL